MSFVSDFQTYRPRASRSFVQYTTRKGMKVFLKNKIKRQGTRVFPFMIYMKNIKS